MALTKQELYAILIRTKENQYTTKNQNIEIKKGLSTDVNFENYLQDSVNHHVISRIPSNLNNSSRIFSSFQAETIFSQ
jgi:DNA polymerase III sliding clamp (beta) subunit (PCNA family)